MADPFPVLIPLLNPNEPEALLAAVYIQERQHVSPGDLLFSIETTKSSGDVASDRHGYVIGLQFTQGQTVQAGDVFCFITETVDAPTILREQPADMAVNSIPDQELPQGLRITQPALALAQAHNLDITRLPSGPLITESAIRSMLANVSASATGQPAEAVPELAISPGVSRPEMPFDPIAIVIYGGGGHGKILIDLVKALRDYRLAGIIDDGLPRNSTILGVPVLGGAEMLPRLHADGVRLAVNGVGGISNSSTRIKIFQQLAEAGFAFPAIVHPTATVEASASIAPGAQVLAHAYLGSAARLGFGAILSTGAIVSHDCVLGDFVNVSPGAILAGGVSVGDGTLIGMGVTVNLGVKVGAGTRIGNNATVNTDVPDGSIIRAGTTWPK
mgnify:CR=1 FL=1